MNRIKLPEGYTPLLSIYETQKAIGLLKRLCEDELAGALHLHRVSAPLFVSASSGLNDDLNGVERPVAFDVNGVPGMAQVVSSMGKGDVSPLLNVGPSQVQVAVLDVEAVAVDEKADAKPDEATAARIEDILRRPRVQERLQQYTTELRQKALVDIRL